MGTMILKGKRSYEERFNAFFRLMGDNYRQLIDEKKLKIYRIFRCGMAHAYFAPDCEIKMLNKDYPAGILIKPDGSYLFIVEKYFQDFMRACKQMYDSMTLEQNPYLLDT